jgi:hypothetical protein
MIRGFRRLISAGAVVFALAAMTAISGDKAAGKNAVGISQGTPAANPQTAWLIEARIRRLHLVRPDLIPYPIAYEIVC